MIIPAFILAAMFVFVLLPDIVVSWHKEASPTVTTYPAGELPAVPK
jgi:hypothetical protein